MVSQKQRGGEFGIREVERNAPGGLGGGEIRKFRFGGGGANVLITGFPVLVWWVCFLTPSPPPSVKPPAAFGCEGSGNDVFGIVRVWFLNESWAGVSPRQLLLFPLSICSRIFLSRRLNSFSSCKLLSFILLVWSVGMRWSFLWARFCGYEESLSAVVEAHKSVVQVLVKVVSASQWWSGPSAKVLTLVWYTRESADLCGTSCETHGVEWLSLLRVSSVQRTEYALLESVLEFLRLPCLK